MATAARVGLASAIVGQLIIAAAEVIWPSNRDLGDVLFSVSPILTGAGLVTAGVAIIRAGVWARPSRFLPLRLGLYTILVLIPVMIASGGPPAPLALWTIGGWDMHVQADGRGDPCAALRHNVISTLIMGSPGPSSHQPDHTLLGTNPITAMQGQTTVEAPTKSLTQNDFR